MNNLVMAGLRADIWTRISRETSRGILKLRQKISERFWKKAVVVGSWYSTICQEGQGKTIRTSVKTAGNTVEQI